MSLHFFMTLVGHSTAVTTVRTIAAHSESEISHAKGKNSVCNQLLNEFRHLFDVVRSQFGSQLPWTRVVRFKIAVDWAIETTAKVSRGALYSVLGRKNIRGFRICRFLQRIFWRLS